MFLYQMNMTLFKIHHLPDESFRTIIHTPVNITTSIFAKGKYEQKEEEKNL